MSNLCNYIPIETLSRRALDFRFNTIHKYLCYLSGAASGNTAQPGQIDIGGVVAMKYNTVQFLGDGITDTLIIPHGLGSTPTAYMVFNDSALTTNFLGRNITPDNINLTVI